MGFNGQIRRTVCLLADCIQTLGRQIIVRLTAELHINNINRLSGTTLGTRGEIEDPSNSLWWPARALSKVPWSDKCVIWREVFPPLSDSVAIGVLDMALCQAMAKIWSTSRLSSGP